MDQGDRGLQILDSAIAEAPKDAQKLQNLLAALRSELETQSQDSVERQKELAAYIEAYEKLTAPANRLGVLLKVLPEELALVVLGDTEYVVNIDPKAQKEELNPGDRVRLNEAYAIIGTVPASGTGGVVKVSEVTDDGRLRVGSDAQNQQGKLVEIGSVLADIEIKVGDEVRLDSSGRMAVEIFPRSVTQDYFVEKLPETKWTDVGGQEEAIETIRETIENPMLFPEIYRRFDKKPIKGVLLYGPPGCGKTLLGKAVAWNLAQEATKRSGKKVEECFLHISGPKILNMWLGETERMVREIFATAREKAREGDLVVIFIDEAESILRTRSSGRWMNISNTVVPQFCAEMDGMVELENVVLILTSNRPDYIDPAILRPERIDRKIKVKRPNKEASRDILNLYIHADVPIEASLVDRHDGLECARMALVESTLSFLWRTNPQSEFMRVFLKNGTKETLFWKDMVSGAMLKSIVDRAKDYAIRRSIEDQKSSNAEAVQNHGLTEDDLQQAVIAEFKENEIFPKSDSVEDWLKLLDFEPEAIVSVKPIGEERGDAIARKSVI